VTILRTRSLDLLILGHIIVNILAFHIFLAKGVGLYSTPVLYICLVAVYLLWVEREAFCGLIQRA
jgi:hypothetical protein